MHRIDGPGATGDNKFTEGDAGLGVPATTVTDDFMNAIQEEVAAVIEGAGIPLDKANNAQLLAALLARFAELTDLEDHTTDAGNPHQVTAEQVGAFSTGDGKITWKNVPDPGWVMLDDGTIGNVGSGASNRANSDCEALFKLLWNNLPDNVATVDDGYGRGASAQDDWDANKYIKLGKNLGRVIGIAGAGAGLTARSLGQALGEETHQLTEDEIPVHTHATKFNQYQTDPTGLEPRVGSAGSTLSGVYGWDSEPTGGDQTHNNMQPSSFFNVMIKL